MLPFGYAVSVVLCVHCISWNPVSMALEAMSAGGYAAILVIALGCIWHGMSGCHLSANCSISNPCLYVLKHYGCRGQTLIDTFCCVGLSCHGSCCYQLCAIIRYVPFCELQQSCWLCTIRMWLRDFFYIREFGFE